MTLGLVGAVVAGCGPSNADLVEQTGFGSTTDPAARVVRLETEGCGYAAGRVGSGVAVGDGLVVTVAHLVVEAETVDAQVNGIEYPNVAVLAADRKTDLAVLRVPYEEMAGVQMSVVEKGARGLVVGGSASGTVPFEVKRVVELTIEEVFGTERHSRRGYEVAAATTDGDSGAGVYDENNNLVGIVFATSQDGATTWVTASSEIEEFLSDIERSDVYDLCN